MSEEKPTLHDGWKSRKTLIGIGLMAAGFVLSAGALLLVEKTTFSEVASFLQIYEPLLFSATVASMAYEKVGLAKANIPK